MTPVQSSESMRVRQELAQLLRRLRAIRKDQLSQAELSERVDLALAEAENTRRFFVKGADSTESHSLCAELS